MKNNPKHFTEHYEFWGSPCSRDFYENEYETELENGKVYSVKTATDLRNAIEHYIENAANLDNFVVSDSEIEEAVVILSDALAEKESDSHLSSATLFVPVFDKTGDIVDEEKEYYTFSWSYDAQKGTLTASYYHD